MEYRVEVANTFEADTPEEAVSEMIAWLSGEAAHTGYRVYDDETGFVGFYDGDDV